MTRQDEPARGADVNAKNNRGVTTLMHAAWNGYTAIVQALLDRGADMNAKDKVGRTAADYYLLHLSAQPT